ncbi:MAG: hypothetical protein HY683_08255 [Chloroflexi bacterium]|nr:hypothetical protein [Chloroflexota bacterium]
MLAPKAAPRWLVLGVDDDHLLAGQVSPDGEESAVFTKLGVLVALGKQYGQNTIAAAEIVRSSGSRLRQGLDPQALEALEESWSGIGGVAWLEHFSTAVQRER